IFIDLALLPQEALQDYDAFLGEFRAMCVPSLLTAIKTPSAPDLNTVLLYLLDCYKGRLVLFIDEIDVLLTVAFRDMFFSQIRAAFNLRDLRPDLALIRVQFVLAGMALQTQLISDPLRSPFNVGGPIQLSDLTLEQVGQMTGHLRESGARLTAHLDEVIYRHTSGSVYLTQLVLEKLWERGVVQLHSPVSAMDIEAVVDTIVATA